jgi:branched-chain amino acid transport system ATP-binding protein
MLQVKNLEVVYHSVVLVLRGISLEVPDQKIVALLGPNGAGKTTLLRALSGLLPIHEGRPTKGSIRWNDEELAGLESDTIVRKGIAQVMEARRIFADLSIEENLLAGAYTRTDRAAVQQEIEKHYARFPVLAERRRRQAGYLSGGEQQMLAIARALMSKPKLLLLDEPSLGLSPKAREDVANLIREINASGVSILLVEQNASIALDLADYGYILENGKIVLDGDAASLKADQDIKEFYLGLGSHGRRNYRDVKLYRRRKRWLS